MASYSWQEAVDFCVRLCKGIPVSNIGIVAVAQVSDMFWKAYPWPWTRDGLDTDITLVNGTQDYALSATDAAKAWRLLNGRVKNTLAGGTIQYRDVRIARHLEPFVESKISWPNFQLVSYEVEIDRIRFEAAVYVPASADMKLQLEYQLFPPKVTNLAQTINFPDYHFNVYCDGLLWMLYRLADDKRAGSAVMTPRGVQYTGQLGIFYDGLLMTKEQEDSGAQDTIYPDISIGAPIDHYIGF